MLPVTPREAETYTVTVEGQTYVVEVAEGGEISQIQPQGQAAQQFGQANPSQPSAAPVPQTSEVKLKMSAPLSGNIFKVHVGIGDKVCAGDVVIILEAMKMETEIRALGMALLPISLLRKGFGRSGFSIIGLSLGVVMDGLLAFWAETGIAHFTAGQALMMAVGALLLYLAIVRGFEPLLLLPIGFGAVLANIPNAGFTDEGGVLYYAYHVGIETGVFPLLIFMGSER